MKTELPIISAILSLCITMTACGGGDSPEPTPEPEPPTSAVAIRVSSRIDDSRAVGSMWDAGDRIGLFMLNATAVDKYSNVAYATSKGDGSFAPTSTTIYVPEDGSGRNFIAYYPYNASMSGSIYAVDLTDQSNQAAIDFMTADRVNGANSSVENISATNADVRLCFRHRLAKVTLAIATGAGFAGDNTELAGMKVRLTGQHTAGTCDVLTSDAVTPGDAGDAAIEMLAAATGTSAEAIVMPADDCSGMKFVFETVGAGTYEWALDKAVETTKFEAGKEYKFAITIGKSGVSVIATIVDWEPGNGSGESGDAVM